MNATTLYGLHSHDDIITADKGQDADRPGLRINGIVDREIPLLEHVRSTPSRTSAQGTTDRPLSGHPGRRFEAGLS